jgi:hypothetical protein
MHEQLHEYIGIIHIHSTYSDGTESVEEIAKIAQDLKLDFLMFTDHNTLQAKRDGLEGWHSGVLVIIGYEINDENDLNHYLAFNLDEELPVDLKPVDYVNEVDARQGYGIIAHPDEKRTSMKRYPAYPWTVWESDKYHGIEIWNQMSEWMEGLTHWNKFWRILHPRRSIISPLQETLAKWDEVNKKRKVVGIGGVDAHAHIYKVMGLFNITVFRYKIIFKTIRTHILTQESFSGEGDYYNDLKIVRNSLLNCNCFISNYYYGDARGFRFWVENNKTKDIIGSELKYDNNTHFHVELPQTAQVRLIKNGQKIATQKGSKLIFNASGQGVYRVEVYSYERPWIFSNHIKLI